MARKVGFGVHICIWDKRSTTQGFGLNVIFEVPRSKNYLFSLTILKLSFETVMKAYGMYNYLKSVEEY